MMETLHEIIKESVSGGFWKFLGYWLILALIFRVGLAIFAISLEFIARLFGR